MADVLRIVTFSKGGRPIVQLDLNDGVIFSLLRDTPKFTSPPRNQEWAQGTGRYNGAVLAHESMGNGVFSAEWYVYSATSGADATLASLDALMDQLESVTPGRYLQFRPDGASRYTYYEIRGPNQWDNQYRWIEFQGTQRFHLAGGWTIAPLGEGERMLIDDQFDANSLTDYTVLVGTPPVYGDQVVNGNFENTQQSADIGGWAPDSTNSPSSYQVVADATATGANALEVVCSASPTAQGVAYHYGMILIGGVTYNISFKFKRMSGTANVNVDLTVAPAGTGGTLFGSFSDAAWTQHTGTFTPPVTAEYMFRAYTATAALCTFRLDDIHVTIANTNGVTMPTQSVTPNYITNPGLEINTTGWVASSVFNNVGAALTRVTAQHNTGVAALQVVTNGSLVAEGCEFPLTGTFPAGVPVVFSMWMKGNVGGETIALGVGTGADFGSKGVTLTTNWQHFYVVWTPTATRTANVSTTINSNVVPTKTWFVDDAFVGSYPGGGNLTVPVGGTGTTTVNHTARGYNYGDVQVSMTFRAGETIGNNFIGLQIQSIDLSNYLMCQLEAGGAQITVYKNTTAGGFAALVTLGLSTIFSPGTQYTMTLRQEGNLITTELWVGPATTGTPAGTASYTLTGAEITQFGFGNAHPVGMRLQLQFPSGWIIEEFSVSPYTYVNRTGPFQVQLGGAIPGHAPARVDAAFSINALGQNVPFNMIAWAPRGTVPFGVYEGEAFTGISGGSVVADAAARGGSLVANTTTSTTMSGSIALTSLNPSPTILQPMRYELWLRVRTINGAVTSPTIQLQPGGGVSGPDDLPTSASGSYTIPLPVPASGTGYYWIRGGAYTLEAPISTSNPASIIAFIMRAATATAAGYGLDFVIAVPANQRATTVTGKSGTSTLGFYASNTIQTKIILSNLAGASNQSAALPVSDDYSYLEPGMGGSLLEFNPGNTDVLFAPAGNMPNNTDTVPAIDQGLPLISRYSLAVVPRYYLPRGS